MKNPENVHLEQRDDGLRDMLIEELLSLIYREIYDADLFNDVYTRIVREHIMPDCPYLVASQAAKDSAGAGVVHYLAILRLDFLVVCRDSPRWPIGGFPHMPAATTAVSIMYDDGDHTELTPGRNINQAALGAIIQLCREISFAYYNQPELPFDPSHGASKRRAH